MELEDTAETLKPWHGDYYEERPHSAIEKCLGSADKFVKRIHPVADDSARILFESAFTQDDNMYLSRYG